MRLIGLTDLLYQDPLFRSISEQLKNNKSLEWNIIRSARPYVLATLAREWSAPIIYLTSSGRQAYNVSE